LFNLQLLAKLRQPTLTSHNKSQLKQHEPSLPNALAKQQRKCRQGKNQLAAVGTKQTPADKATSKWQSQRLSGRCSRPSSKSRTTSAPECLVNQRDDVGVLAAAADYE